MFCSSCAKGELFSLLRDISAYEPNSTLELNMQSSKNPRANSGDLGTMADY